MGDWYFGGFHSLKSTSEVESNEVPRWEGATLATDLKRCLRHQFISAGAKAETETSKE
jgi:hypothetical protein